MTTSRPGAAPAFAPETLFVATALAPTVYSRNRMFSLFREPAYGAARRRGQLVRSVAREWLKAAKNAGGIDTRWSERGGGAGGQCGWELWYRVPAMHLERRLQLSALERACLLYLLERGKASDVVLSREERALVERALAKLAT